MRTEQRRRVREDFGQLHPSLRVEVLALEPGQVVALDLRVTLLNLSRDGFLLHLPMELTVGETRAFRFTTGQPDAIVLRARVVRGMRTTAAGQASYTVGFEFMDRGDGRTEQDLERLIAAITAAPVKAD